MPARLISTWDSFRESLWFAPALLTLIGLMASILMPLIDEQLRGWVSTEGRWFHTSAESARSTLSWISTTLMTVACLVLSVTVVALTQTTSLYGSRLLRNFMATNAAQMTLGTMLGTVLYCMIVQKAVDVDEGLVPHLSVSVALLAGICSLGMMFYFIHSVAESIQAQNVVENVARELDEAINSMYPQQIGEPPRSKSLRQMPPAELEGYLDNLGKGFFVVPSKHEGYFLAVDSDSLLHTATDSDVIVRMLVRPGDFVIREQPLAQVWYVDDEKGKSIARGINASCVAGRHRTPRQDIECAVNELVEVAVRALSPGINDPFTAITCIDRFSASLSRLAQREAPPALRCDKDENIRVISQPISFGAVLDASFNQIRQAGQRSPAVAMRLLESLVTIGGAVSRDEDRQAVRRHADMVLRACRTNFEEELDREDAEARHERVCAALNHQKSLEPASRDQSDEEVASQA